MPDVTTEIVRGPVAIVYPDGSKWTTERTITRISDVRDTPFGPVDFGSAVFGPCVLVKIESAKHA